MPRLTAVLFTLALVLPTLPAAPVPREADKPPVYFPTRVGDKWVWSWVGNETEFAEVVTKVENKEGENVITVETTADGTPKSPEKYKAVETYSLTEKGLFRLSHDDYRYEKPWCLLKAPHRAGEKWEVDVKDHFGVGGKSSHVIGESEWVEVPAGKFRALRVEHTREDPPGTATSWHAPGVGQVKMVVWSRAGKEEGAVALKSFTPGK